MAKLALIGILRLFGLVRAATAVKKMSREEIVVYLGGVEPRQDTVDGRLKSH
jgi:hypothetical protein